MRLFLFLFLKHCRLHSKGWLPKLAILFAGNRSKLSLFSVSNCHRRAYDRASLVRLVFTRFLFQIKTATDKMELIRASFSLSFRSHTIHLVYPEKVRHLWGIPIWDAHLTYLIKLTRAVTDSGKKV